MASIAPDGAPGQAGYRPWIPPLQREGANSDREIVDRMLDELLAIQAPEDPREKMLDYLAKERVQLGLKDGHLYDAQGDAERVLRRLAHLILSLPEAQLG